jgi:hypothetical protein
MGLVILAGPEFIPAICLTTDLFENNIDQSHGRIGIGLIGNSVREIGQSQPLLAYWVLCGGCGCWDLQGVDTGMKLRTLIA